MAGEQGALYALLKWIASQSAAQKIWSMSRSPFGIVGLLGREQRVLSAAMSSVYRRMSPLNSLVRSNTRRCRAGSSATRGWRSSR